MIFPSDAFSACVSDRWHMAIGDPNVAGWAIFATYALAAVAAVMVLRRRPFAPAHHRKERVLWGMIALLMTGIALNKQLDLQSLMTTLGRCLAQDQGWYENRRMVQRDFIFGLIALAALTGAGLYWMLHGVIRQNLLSLLGLTALAGFVLIRGGHLLHIFVPDQIAVDYLVHALTTILEVLCPILIIAAAWRILRLQPLQTRL